MLYIGIDPGKKGAWAEIGVGEGGQIVHVTPWDAEQFVATMRGVGKQIQDHGMKALACVEKVGARPGQGTVSMFSFGQSYGYILGVLESCGVPYQLVVPNRWKGEFGLTGKEKRASIDVCKALYPDVSLRPTNRSRVDSDGMSDALCLATFAARRWREWEN